MVILSVFILQAVSVHMFVFRSALVYVVSKELSTAEKKQLELVDGVSLPPAKRKRRRGHREPQTTGTVFFSLFSYLSKHEGKYFLAASDKTTAITEAKWKEVKQYWEPNPQLRGTDLGRHAPKVRERELHFRKGRY